MKYYVHVCAYINRHTISTCLKYCFWTMCAAKVVFPLLKMIKHIKLGIYL